MDTHILSRLLEGKGKTELPRDHESLFRGWFGNNMAVLLMNIQSKHPMKESTRMRMGFFMHDVEHHYVMPRAPRSVRNAFRYLRRYLKAIPVHPKHSGRALDMVSRIYEELGLVFPWLPRDKQIAGKHESSIC